MAAGNLHAMFDPVPIFSHDVWLRAATAVAAAYFGRFATDGTPAVGRA